MSRENVEVVRRVLDAWNGGSTADAEFHPATQLGGPDVPTVFRGYDGLRRFRDEILSVWDYFHVTPEEFIESGDDVLVLSHGRGRGKASGIEIDQSIAYLCTLQDGKITRMWIFQDRDTALEAVGLRE